MELYKICHKCKEERQKIDFPKNRARFDGLHYVCRECFRNRHVETYSKEKRKSVYLKIKSKTKCPCCLGKMSPGNNMCRGCLNVKRKDKTIILGRPFEEKEKHLFYKGFNKVGNDQKHYWIKRNYGIPKKCEECGRDGLTGRKIHWANIDHKYSEDREDWRRLCAKCHWWQDRNNNLR